ncbi:uncharacterized protein BCR38DRAFT_429101 [Pseudomassariella vexata]|uniref:Uncharacterized protein n=1 Tax=Pseudomassariella vexata TaxID=1141098 RepID=A0A1Y2E3E1_9PEZI|nr:uncharacterized protein BCR38DRAFT_429101 [Pseudomassariella vexata]ORY66052.1 hypothetical protein BCR38DRAFT_429101 [Pseudomassariella vexata]
MAANIQDDACDVNKYSFPPNSIQEPHPQPWLEVPGPRDEQGTPGLQPVPHEPKYSRTEIQGLYGGRPQQHLQPDHLQDQQDQNHWEQPVQGEHDHLGQPAYEQYSQWTRQRAEQAQCSQPYPYHGAPYNAQFQGNLLPEVVSHSDIRSMQALQPITWATASQMNGSSTVESVDVPFVKNENVSAKSEMKARQRKRKWWIIAGIVAVVDLDLMFPLKEQKEGTYA